MKQIEKLKSKTLTLTDSLVGLHPPTNTELMAKINELVEAVNSLMPKEEGVNIVDLCRDDEDDDEFTPEAQEVDVRKLCNELLHLGYDYSKSESGSKKEKKQDERVEQIIKTIEEAINRNKE